MRIVSQLADVAVREPVVLTIGAFDGVHRGHQALVRRATERAAQEGARAALVTFWPHPLAVLRPEEAPKLLTTRDEKMERLRALGGLDVVLEMPFTPQLAQLTPEAFLAALRDRLEIRGVVEGPNFAFGRDRAGDVAWLRRAGEAAGFAVETLEVEAGGQRVGSGRIRALVAAGQVEDATELLGHSYIVAGTVIEGDKRGRLLGFPTANLRVDPVKLLPANGVYAVRARLPGEERTLRMGVANVGVRPTFGEGSPPLVEVHLLDESPDLYGQWLEAEFVARLREERRFSGVDALRAQIHADAERARTLLTDQ
jgi:riboflavin kinase/FMN adenylyltransferase